MTDGQTELICSVSQTWASPKQSQIVHPIFWSQTVWKDDDAGVIIPKVPLAKVERVQKKCYWHECSSVCVCLLHGCFFFFYLVTSLMNIHVQ